MPGPARCADEDLAALHQELRDFDAFGRPTEVGALELGSSAAGRVPVYVNQFWTARQRMASSLHEVSYFACFKPELPRFFVERLTAPGEVVFDPFLGRGTTPVEAALHGRVPWGVDVNPLSRVMALGRLAPPTEAEVAERLARIDTPPGPLEEELLVFYHRRTLARIQSLRRYLLDRGEQQDALDRWIQVVALNRLTGHSAGFFSVYTMPPNQAATLDGQRRINASRDQVPPERDVDALILKKTRTLQKTLTAEQRAALAAVAPKARIHTGDARKLGALPAGAVLSGGLPADGFPAGEVALTVTSPPFLNVYDYARINWLRCWFCGLDAKAVGITTPPNLPEWRRFITAVMRECLRLSRPGGYLAFEVGEIRKGELRLEEEVLPCGVTAGWQPELVLIHAQDFVKTSSLWGVANNRHGTNSNRVVLLRKAE